MSQVNILVVDDEAPLADSIATYIRGNERKVETAYDLHSAENHIRRDNVDIVILDVIFQNNENANGLDFLEMIKNQKPMIEFILMSGYGNTIMEKASRRWGGVRFFHKPIDLEIMNELVDNMATRIKEQYPENEEDIVPIIPGTISDDEAKILKRKYLTGDEGALKSILVGYKNLIFSVARNWYHLSVEDAEDIYQDVCVEVMVKLSADISSPNVTFEPELIVRDPNLLSLPIVELKLISPEPALKVALLDPAISAFKAFEKFGVNV